MIIIKRIIALTVIISVSCMLFSGCGETTIDTEKTSAEPLLTRSSETLETSENTFCFDDFNYITIGDTTVSLPFSVDELGDGYYIDNYVDENNVRYDNEYCICKDNNQVLYVTLDDNQFIESFSTADFNSFDWNVCGFGYKSTIDDVLSTFKKPNKVTEDTEKNSQMFLYAEEKGMIFIRFENDKLSFFSITCNYNN